MRNAFAKRFAAVMLVLCMLAALPVATAYAADEKTGYVVTFRAGEHGTFSEDYISDLQEKYGATDVYVNASKTVVSVLVLDDQVMPAAPDRSDDVVINSDSTDYVAIATVDDKDTTYSPGDRATQDYDFVAQYALRGDRQDVSYVVRYLLQGTEEEVAPSVRGTAPEGLTLTLTAAVVNEYSVVGSGVQQATMTKNSDNSPVEVIFYYTQNEHVNSTTQYEDGGTTVEYNDVNVVAGAATTGGAAAAGGTAGVAAGGTTAGGAAGGAAAGGAGADGADGDQGVADQGAAQAPQAGGEEAIGDNETPQAGGSESIGDNETPLAGSESGVSVPAVVGGIVVLLVVVAAVVLVIRKRRNGSAR